MFFPVAAGKKANDDITLMESDLKTAGIEIIKSIEFNFHLFDPETLDAVLDSDVIRIETSAAPSFVQEYDDSGFTALDRDGFRVVIKKLDSANSLWGTDIYVYAENNTDKNAVIQIRDMSVNGFMIDPIFSCEIAAGKKAFDSITFLESSLEENNITSIDTLEFYFHVFDSDRWDTIFDSDTVTVKFNE